MAVLPADDKFAVQPARAAACRSALARSGAVDVIAEDTEHDLQWYLADETKVDTWYEL